jgi:hypothetical protein
MSDPDSSPESPRVPLATEPDPDQITHVWSAGKPARVVRWTRTVRGDEYGGRSKWTAQLTPTSTQRLEWAELVHDHGPVFTSYAAARDYLDGSESDGPFTPDEFVPPATQLLDERARIAGQLREALQVSEAVGLDQLIVMVRGLRQAQDSGASADPVGDQLADGVQSLVAEVVGLWNRDRGNSNDFRYAMDRLDGGARVLGWVEL